MGCPLARHAVSGALLAFFNPGHLDCLEDTFAAVPGIIIKAVERYHPVAQINKIHMLRIGSRIFFIQFDGNIECVGPFQ